MTYRYVTAEVEVNLSEFDTDDLIEELENRGYDYNTQGVDADEMRVLLEQIWIKRRQGNNNFDPELNALIYGVLGKIV